jgi:copper(I)-binding protein
MDSGYHRHMNVPSFILGLMLLAGASAAVANPVACVPVAEQAWVRAAPPGATALAGYAVLRNPCARSFAVTDVSSSDFAMGMIHETLVEKGVSRMRHAESLPLPARGVLTFEPGGKHMMLMHPRRVLKEGDRVRLVLKLSDGRKLNVDAVVRREAPTKP